jgi:hypothetical protein
MKLIKRSEHHKNKIWEEYLDKKILIVSIIINLIGILLCFQFNMKFIGFLKLDFVSYISLLTAALQIVIIISSLAIVLFILGKIINSKTRFVDILNNCMVGIIPFFLLTVFNVNNFIYNDLEKLKSIILNQQLEKLQITSLPILLLFSLFTILILIWSIVILYQGFKTATNLKQTKNKVYFAIALLLADVISRVLISYLI